MVGIYSDISPNKKYNYKCISKYLFFAVFINVPCFQETTTTLSLATGRTTSGIIISQPITKYEDERKTNELDYKIKTNAVLNDFEAQWLKNVEEKHVASQKFTKVNAPCHPMFYKHNNCEKPITWVTLSRKLTTIKYYGFHY